eukprot:9176065-Pyramimonas_sp.AAC.1
MTPALSRCFDLEIGSSRWIRYRRSGAGGGGSESGTRASGGLRILELALSVQVSNIFAAAVVHVVRSCSGSVYCHPDGRRGVGRVAE